MSSAEPALVSAWYRGAPWLWLLRPLEVLFRAVSAARRTLYSLQLLPSYRAAVPVAVVGNITVGGTGKTPIVIALVQALQARGLRVGVVSRGYGAETGGETVLVDAETSSERCGDEPLLIWRRTGCAVAVNPKRGAAVRDLLAIAAVDIILSDDGLQHYALARDYEIAVIDARRQLGNGWCLPAGPLREPPSRLQRVDYVLYRGSDNPETGVQYSLGEWVNLRSGERKPLHAFGLGGECYAVAGIGQPQQFFSALQQLGVAFERCVFPDHHHYTAADLAPLADRPVLMTEKDAVKCVHLAGENAWYVELDAQVPTALVAALAGVAQRSSSNG